MPVDIIKDLASSNKTNPWNKGHTKLTHSSVLKISNTLRTLKIDNLSSWREKKRKQNAIPLERNTDLAFLIGLILGDGNLYKFPRTECLNITLGTDKPLLYEYSAKIMTRTLRKEVTIRRRKNAACVDLRIYQCNLSNRLGVPLGSRGAATIKLPPWITQNKECLIACLKGLFEAEGSFSIHLPSCTYNFSFSNRNVSLLDEVEKTLILLGFHPERRYNAVRLRKRQEALAFEQLISFRQYPLI